MAIVTEGDAGAYAVAATAFNDPLVLVVAHMAFSTSPAAMLKIAVRETTMVAPLLCRLATMVEPTTSTVLMRGQKRNSMVLADVLAICAVKAMEYSPASTKVISVNGGMV